MSKHSSEDFSNPNLKKYWDKIKDFVDVEKLRQDLIIPVRASNQFVFVNIPLDNEKTVCNYFRVVGGDYEQVAHISENGNIELYDKSLPPLVIKEIEEKAAEFYPQKDVIAKLISINNQYPFDALKVEYEARDAKADLPINESFRSFTRAQLKLALDVLEGHPSEEPLKESEAMTFKDRHGNGIHEGMYLRLEDGTVEKIYTAGGSLGINASNENYLRRQGLDIETFREVYPLYQFDLSKAEICKTQVEENEDDYDMDC